MDVSLPGTKNITYLTTGALSATELNNLYTNLPTITDDYYIQVTNQPGKAASDTSIATAKGWTVL